MLAPYDHYDRGRAISIASSRESGNSTVGRLRSLARKAKRVILRRSDE